MSAAAAAPEPAKPTPIPREPALPMFTRPTVPPTDTPTTTEEGASEYQQARRKFNAKPTSAYLDPCQEAANRSLRCLARNQKDKDMCNDYFAAYRECKKKWIEERKEEKRRRGGWFY